MSKLMSNLSRDKERLSTSGSISVDIHYSNLKKPHNNYISAGKKQQLHLFRIHSFVFKRFSIVSGFSYQQILFFNCKSVYFLNHTQGRVGWF